ncbi:hypothetical protein D6C90_08456 [Aureobasidium pullulans]|uniref:Uncharacterized protein n=1 Tax=Aureobasidium pullulans TaxID=5580 RepID=A0A4S9U7U8_AURPU|nr:hypothetical protein D6C90_08456 [Aureobasidium pullulans]
MAKKTAFRCRECWYRHENKSFTSFAHMKSHLGSVHKMGWFCCSVRNCDYRALRRDAVTKHITAEKKSQPGGRHAKAEARVNQRLERAIDAETNLCRWPHTTPWTPPAGAAGPVLNPTPAVTAAGAASVVAPIIPPVPAPAAGSSQTVSASAAPPVSAPSQADVSPTGGVTNDNDSITSNDIDEEMEDELPGSNHTSLPSSPSPASPSPTLQQPSMLALPSPLRFPPPHLPLSKLATRAIVIGRYYLDRFEDRPASFSTSCNIKLISDAIEGLEDGREIFNNSPSQFAYNTFAIGIEVDVGDMVEAIRWYEDLFGHHMGALREDVAKLKEMAAGVEENREARKACGVGEHGGEVQDEDDQNDQHSQDEDQSEDQDVGWSEDQDGDQSGGQDVQNGQDGQDELDEPMESPLSPLDEPLQSPLSPLDEPMQSPPSPFKDLTEEQADELYE